MSSLQLFTVDISFLLVLWFGKKHSGRTVFFLKGLKEKRVSFILLGFSLLGIIDAIVPRCRRVNKLIMILANKCKMQVARKEQERIKKILEN